MAVDLAEPGGGAIPASLSARKTGLVIFYVAVLVFITESSFRTRQFAVSVTLDWQVALQLAVWGFAGIFGILLGAIGSANLRRPIGFGFALFLLLMIFSGLYAPPAVRLGAFASAIGYVTFYAFALGVARHLTERQAWLGVALGLAADVLSAPFLFVAHLEPGGDLQESTDQGRMHGFLSHSGELGTDAALLCIFALLIATRSERKGRWYALAAVSFVIIILSTGKTGLAALFVSGGIIWWRRNLVLRALTPVWAAAGLFFGFLMATVGLQNLIPNGVLELVSRSGHASDALTMTGRTKIWSFAFDRWLDRPFMGWGWNSGRFIIFGFFQGWTILQFHSMYLNCLVYLGAVGLLVFLVVLLYRLVPFFSNPDFTWDWLYLFILVEGLAEQGALSDKPTVHSFVFMLCLLSFAHRSPPVVRPSKPKVSALQRRPVRRLATARNLGD